MVCVEALAVKTLLRHQRLAKAISAVGWGELCANRSTKRRGRGVHWSQ